MAITPKEKELAAIGTAVATGCKPCTDYHIQAVRKAGASDEEIQEAVGLGILVRNRAAEIMKEYALEQLRKKGPGHGSHSADEATRVRELVCVGAAFGINCVSSLEKHLAGAQAAGIELEDIAKIVRLAAFIKGKAASHVERLAHMREGEGEKVKAAAYQREVGSCC